METQLVPIQSLNPAKYNPRTMPREQMEALKRSLEKYGFVEPVVVNKRGNIIVGGHQRVSAWKALGRKSLPVLFVDLDEADEKALNLALNKISGVWDDNALAEVISSLKGLGFDDFGVTGFSNTEIDKLGGLQSSDELGGLNKDDNAIPEVDTRKEPVTMLGDVYAIGPHRLMCGDATALDNVRTLMSKKLCDVVITDPPYNVAYVGKTKDAMTINNDDLSNRDFYDFLYRTFYSLIQACKPGTPFYVFHADSEGENFRKAMRSAGWQLKQCLIWAKNSFVMGRQDYQWQHEPILYGWAPGAAHPWYGERTQTTLLHFDRPTRNDLHPTMKPVPLIEYLLENSSQVGDLVLDLFGGSGSTMVACERKGRTAYLMEQDPKYCDVIVERMRNQFPELAVTKQSTSVSEGMACPSNPSSSLLKVPEQHTSTVKNPSPFPNWLSAIKESVGTLSSNFKSAVQQKSG